MLQPLSASVFGQKRTSALALHISGYGGPDPMRHKEAGYVGAQKGARLISSRRAPIGTGWFLAFLFRGFFGFESV